MAKSKKYLALKKIIGSDLGKKDVIELNISKYEKEVGTLPQMRSIKNSSSIKTLAEDYGYEIEIEKPKIRLIKRKGN